MDIGQGASTVMTQIMADALNAAVIVSEVQEASARGAALLALVAINKLADISAAPVQFGRRYEPNAQATAAYRDVMRRQADLYRFLVQETTV